MVEYTLDIRGMSALTWSGLKAFGVAMRSVPSAEGVYLSVLKLP